MNKPKRMERLAYKTIGQETIILDTRLNKEVHQLNEVATMVWNLCDGDHDVQSIVEMVCAEFEVNFEEASKDIAVLLKELSAKSLLVDHST